MKLIKYLHLFLALLFFSCQSINQRYASNQNLNWIKLDRINKINASGIEINTPSGNGWEMAYEKDGKLIKKILIRNINLGKNHSVFGHIRAIEKTSGIHNSTKLKNHMIKYLKNGKTFNSREFSTFIPRNCTTPCANYSFFGKKNGISQQGRMLFNFKVDGNFRYNPKNNMIFEVMLSERYPLNSKSKLSTYQKNNFFNSFKFLSH